MTAAITLVSGIGTYCVAWNAEQLEGFADFVPYKSLYKAFVILTIAVAIAAVVDVYGMIRRRKWAYLATMVGMLLLRIPGIWQAISSRKPSDGSGAALELGSPITQTAAGIHDECRRPSSFEMITRVPG
ncbi:MAG: hypothetical protein KOO61_05175 [Spirochaetales bacterium]|nr:hypothetical protein [Spirochaetales bacterium]